MPTKINEEKIKCWRLSHLPEVELMQANYVQQKFAKHTHDVYAFGVIERGALKFSYQKRTWEAFPGNINLVIPGEAHDGQGTSAVGWSYRMLYIKPSFMQNIMGELIDQPDCYPFFRAGVIEDSLLAARIWQMHKLFEDRGADPFEQESLLKKCLGSFVLQYADRKIVLPKTGNETKTIKKVCDYIEEKYRENVSLAELAAVAGFSPTYLIRVFSRQMGVPPHIYLKQTRIKKAKLLISKGISLSFIANEIGFSDQSHFSRQFKQIIGLTPGLYAKLTR